ncbi:MAG: hypothetical protein K6A79_06350 [Ruminococcus sp.]|nr:hypothetical protein [Ruminococcus sp.]
MSNLIKCSCENCGGLLEVKNDAEQIVCKYCGTAFLLREQIIINNINITPQALPDGSTKAKRKNEKINYSSSYIGVEKIKAK